MAILGQWGYNRRLVERIRKLENYGVLQSEKIWANENAVTKAPRVGKPAHGYTKRYNADIFIPQSLNVEL